MQCIFPARRLFTLDIICRLFPIKKEQAVFFRGKNHLASLL
jgi:hypothetical protein